MSALLALGAWVGCWSSASWSWSWSWWEADADADADAVEEGGGGLSWRSGLRWSRRLRPRPSLGEEAAAAGVVGEEGSAMAEERARMEPSRRLPRPSGDGVGAIGGGECGGVVGWASSPIMVGR